MLGKRNRSWQYRAVGRQPVKSRAFFPEVGGGGGFFAALFLALSVAPLGARAEDPSGGPLRARPLLLGGSFEQAKEEIPLDPRLPVGRLRTLPRPFLMKSRACSLRRPVCVESASPDRPAEELGFLERALEEVAYGWDLPDAFASFERPLLWKVEPAARLELEVGEAVSRGFDRGEPSCFGGAPTLETARRCVLEASLAARAPATAEWLRAGWAAESARELGNAPEVEAEMRSTFAHPEAGVLTLSQLAPARPEAPASWVTPLRSARLFRYLAERSRLSAAISGYLTLTLAATQTSAASLRFDAEPDVADVLRATHGHDRNEVARFYDDFAKWSFFDANRQALDLAIDWEIEGESLPRSVAFSSPVEPTGSVYALVHLPRALRNEVLGFRTSCEAPVSYVWSVTRLSGKNEEISTFPLTFQERNPVASGRVLPAQGMEKLLVVGTNLGGVALTHPFDPDHGPHEAHGCRLTVDVVPGGSP